MSKDMKLKQERSKEEVAIPLYNKGLVRFHTSYEIAAIWERG
jgi:predicted HTH domain antitoxin